MNQLLRERFGFKGYIVSDCGSVTDIFEYHKINDTPEEAAALAVKSGVDLNCGRGTFFPYKYLFKAVDQKLISEKEIDIAVYRLMLARMKLGMFDPPEMVTYSKIPAEVIDCKEHQELALEMARKSIVLLKNEDNILPLEKSIKKIAVIGPNAANENVLLGNYNGIPSNPISLYQGLKTKLPVTEILYSKGCEYVNAPDLINFFPPSLLFTDSRFSEKGIKVEFFNNKDFAGEPVVEIIDRYIFLSSEFGVPYKELKENNFSVRWTGFINIPENARYKFIMEAPERCKVYLNDKLIMDCKEENFSDELELKKGTEQELVIDLIADNEEFDALMFLKINAEDLRSNAIEAAENADVVVMSMGISTEIEGEELGIELPGFAGGDRITIELPEVQQNLIKTVSELNKPIVLVLMGGGSFALPNEDKICNAILEAWYPGQSGGTAIADVLFGDYNPGGRLPLTFYKSTNDLPDLRNYDMENRTYKFFRGEPLYPFGFGLSYTKFSYSNLKMPESIPSGQDFTVSVEIENTGSVGGDEVVQLYLKDVKASARVPRHSLQGFKRIHLKAGEKKKIEFILEPKNLALLDSNLKWVVEPGEFIISVGGGQPDFEKLPVQIISQSINVIGDEFIINN
jgi:beta-glucosidase